MAVEQIKEYTGRIIGSIETQGNGDKIARTYSGQILGYYKASRNVTTDFGGTALAIGDITSYLVWSKR